MSRTQMTAALAVATAVMGVFAPLALAQPITLQQGTAFFSQGGFSPDQMNDNLLVPNAGGWANNAQGNNIAVFETTTDVTSPFGKRLQFSLLSGGYGLHELGRFRFSATEDNRATYANDADSGGTVAANWIPLNLVSITSDDPDTTFTLLGDKSILAGGPLGAPDPETYTVTLDAPGLDAITGFRLEAFQDPSLPPNAVAGNGPGRAANGNFVVIELDATALRDLTFFEAFAPEPGTITIWSLLGVTGLGVCVWRRRKRGGARESSAPQS